MATVNYLLVGLVCCGYISSCASQMGLLGGMMGGGMNLMDHAFLDNAVKTIVGPHAEVTPELSFFASQQPGRPVTAFDYFPYVHFLQDIGQRVGVAMPGSTRKVFGLQAREAVRNNAMAYISGRATLSAMTGAM